MWCGIRWTGWSRSSTTREGRNSGRMPPPNPRKYDSAKLVIGTHVITGHKSTTQQAWFKRSFLECFSQDMDECNFEKGTFREQQLSYFCGNALECRQVPPRIRVRAHFHISKRLLNFRSATERQCRGQSTIWKMNSLWSGFMRKLRKL